MAKQTFTTGQVLTAAQMTSLQQTAMLGGAASAKTANYTLVAADAGTAISMSNAGATTITVNTALFAAGDTVQITNLGAGVCTITAGTATVNTSATLALAQYESGTLDFTSASAAIFIKGAGGSAGGGGKVLQVVYANYSTATSASGSGATDSGLTATITPTLNTSKVLVLVQLNGCFKNSADVYMSAFIYKASSSILQFAARYMETSNSNLTRFGGIGASYLDSPATTSATTYKVVFSNPEGVGTVGVQNNSANSTITLLEIGA